ncbi:MAG: hypothetical protein NZ518_01515, partial [Dehalococcoidia bacterium]|nr:hypothetical protein [Dehalococcoidia bacterium]
MPDSLSTGRRRSVTLEPLAPDRFTATLPDLVRVYRSAYRSTNPLYYKQTESEIIDLLSWLHELDPTSFVLARVNGDVGGFVCVQPRFR